MKTWQVLVLGVFIGLLAAGLILLVSTSPQGESIQLIPLPTPAPLTAHVTGAVQNSGLVTLPRGSRVNDAVQAAGGLTADAAVERINLAAPLKDGQQVFVPSKAETTAQTGSSSGSSPTSAEVNDPININTASSEELDRLPGIGPAKAGEIIAYREANGPFLTVEDVQLVPGIGPALFEQIKDRITVAGP